MLNIIMQSPKMKTLNFYNTMITETFFPPSPVLSLRYLDNLTVPTLTPTPRSTLTRRRRPTST